MNNILEIRRHIHDPQRSLKDRLFLLTTSVLTAALHIMLIAGFFIRESAINLAVLAISDIVIVVILFSCKDPKRCVLGSRLVSLVLIFFFLPFYFLSGGGLYGGKPGWYIFGFAYITLVVDGKRKFLYQGLEIAVILITYILMYFNPGDYRIYERSISYLDSVLSIILINLLLGILIIFVNLMYTSEKRRAEEQKQKVEELTRARSRFFSNMSHEIRTPINTIIGLDEMILRETESEAVAEDARNIQDAGRLLLSIINDILDINRIESGKLEIHPAPYDVGDMLSDIVNMLWLRAQDKGLTFRVEIDQTMPSKLFGDEIRIRQILVNILSNAVKYTQEGEVKLTLQYKKTTAQSVIVTYIVEDTGSGIRKENIPHLFDAFERVEEDSENRFIEGTGLGLAIVKELVTLMNGEITVNSVYTKGSTFIVSIPQQISDDTAIGELNLESRHQLRAREHYRQSFEAPNARLLFVDDNETNLLVAKKLLTDTLTNIDTALSGAEALRMTLQTKYDLIFMDHLMPGMDGIECLHAIRDQVGGMCRETPVIVLTANAGSEYIARYNREGFDDYLIKPVNGAMLESEALKFLPQEKVTITSREAMAGELIDPISSMNRQKVSTLITTESVADLPVEMLQEYRIEVIPFHVFTDRGDFLDGFEAESDGILAYLEGGGEARVQSPTVAEFETFFAEQLTHAQNIIHISAARHISKAYEHALEAASTFENVSVYDSGQMSAGLGLMAMIASMRVKDGLTKEQIIDEMSNNAFRVRTSLIVSNTTSLYKAGYISSRLHILSRALLLHPVLNMKKSRMVLSGMHMGTREQAWKHFIRNCLRDKERIDPGTIIIVHVGRSEEELDMIEEEIRKYIAFRDIVRQKISPALTITCGPATFGLMYAFLH